jgi:hypothetical protein
MSNGMKMSPKTFSLAMPLTIFLVASAVWLLILSQSISFILSLFILSSFAFLLFWRGLIISRKAGELFGLKNRKQIFIVSLTVALGFCELAWGISFLPFPFFILSGLFTVIFTIAFDVLKEYFKQHPDLFADLDRINFKKILIRDMATGIIFIIIFISISSWLPSRY